jgi:hypothetical protein
MLDLFLPSLFLNIFLCIWTFLHNFILVEEEITVLAFSKALFSRFFHASNGNLMVNLPTPIFEKINLRLLAKSNSQ